MNWWKINSWWEVLGLINLIVYAFIRMTLITLGLVVMLYVIAKELTISPLTLWTVGLYIILFISMELYRLFIGEFRRFVPKKGD